MKLKYILGIGLGLMIVGGLLAGVSYALGAQTSLTWENGPRIIEMVQETKKISSEEKVNKIIVQADNQSVTIKRGLNFSVETSYDKTKKPKIIVENQTLTVTTNGQAPAAMVDFNSPESGLTITIPQDLELAELTVEGKNSFINLEEFTSKKITTNTYGGSISFNDVKSEQLKADDKLGNINLNELTIEQLAITASDSNIYFDDQNETKATIALNNSHLTLQDMEKIGLDIQLDGDSYINKNDGETASTSFSQGNKNIKITGQNSSVYLGTEEEYELNDEYNEYDYEEVE
ncbi:hypothetical protein A5844_001390 [Enterococcus sp. 10A9_DIV0425]|uniref:DUF4097 domain-containing protein n=1 Tax=Candidatus Enterococcus wittei TaxID=1987383 RepID=A0A242K2I4_9ENTE|nr:DUF4097 family beta strand repeat-containing protein [Enterococcus sp. 10A9_DIV0425]OTP11256.1 hypothetical protein A5844_001390 [Enterococcus sp. 10A9_DIV0425]THE15810.1 hypothetical protein E1H99_02275 [Enterococcus hirae]